MQISDSCKYLRFWSVGRIYDTSIPRSIAEKEHSLIAWAFDDELLSEDYGGPIRALIPYLWGYKSAKSMIEIELMDYYVPGFGRCAAIRIAARSRPASVVTSMTEARSREFPMVK